MALPDPNQVAGKNIAIYDAYYKQVDPKGTGAIEAMVAAKFLKKTGLSDVVLSRIWDLSDPNGKGYLDRQGLFVALKLVGLAQAGHDINMRNIFMETNVPKVGDIPKIAQPTSIQAIPPTNADWSMKPQDREKYTTLFESLMPVNGLIPGNKVKGLLMESKLPLETLGRIWDLADQDKDGSLDKHEFIVAMHLVYQALDKRAIPTALPAELQKPKTPPNNGGFDSGSVDFVANFPKELPPPAVPPLPVSMPPAKPPMPRIPPTMPSVPSMSLIETDLMSAMSPPGNNQQTAPLISTDWVITPQEKIRYDQIFTTSDQDMDGLVSGLEIKDVFLKSGVPQQCLAHIWALCDTHQSGKLTSDQFALAMWLVERKKSGIEPPQVLAPNMIPPSVRGGASTIDPMGGATVIQQAPPQPTYSNPELEMISKEIEELAKERRTIETDIAQKEADIRIKSGEVRSLQSELDTLAATLKQLENQKGEAQKRLDDLKTQKTVLDAELKEVNDEIDVTKSQVNKIRDQCLKQESTIKDQESELDTKRSELQKLKDEESALEHQYEDSQKELDKLTCKLQDTQLEISQIKAMVSQLQESQRQMNDALAACKTAIEDNEPALVSEYILKLEPDFREARKTLEPKVEPKEDPFNDQTAGGVSGNSVGFGSDGFKSNGFSSDPFTNTNGSGGFSDGFGATSGTGFDDSFGSSFQSSSAKKDDPFSAGADPFNDSKIKAVTPDPSKDEFGSDPFAVLHAPTSSSSQGGLSPMQGQKSGPPARPESPIPALPPKKSKQPPPRPAPPRPLQGPGSSTKPSPSGFGDSGGSGGGGFADFADFDNKKVAATDSDFVEDPFKDYRYEDPFSIQDPFADDDIEAVDPFSFDSPSKIDAAQPPTKINNNLKNITNDHHDGKKMSKTTTTTKVLNTSLSSVPTNNNHNNNNNNNNQTESFASFDAFSLESNTNTFKTTKSNAEAKSDFFDAFNDNFNKNMNKNSEAFDPFGTASGGGSGVGSTSAKSNFDDIFSDDSFSKLSSSSLSKSNHNSSNNNVDVNFAKFETEFTADFNSSELATTIPSNKNNLFSKYESNNNSKLSNLKINKNNLKKYEDQATASTKSKHLDAFGGGVGIGGSATKAPSNKPGDNFDADLEEALKRSLVEQ